MHRSVLTNGIGFVYIKAEVVSYVLGKKSSISAMSSSKVICTFPMMQCLQNYYLWTSIVPSLLDGNNIQWKPIPLKDFPQCWYVNSVKCPEEVNKIDATICTINSVTYSLQTQLEHRFVQNDTEVQWYWMTHLNIDWDTLIFFKHCYIAQIHNTPGLQTLQTHVDTSDVSYSDPVLTHVPSHNWRLTTHAKHWSLQ